MFKHLEQIPSATKQQNLQQRLRNYTFFQVVMLLIERPCLSKVLVMSRHFSALYSIWCTHTHSRPQQPRFIAWVVFLVHEEALWIRLIALWNLKKDNTSPLCIFFKSFQHNYSKIYFIRFTVKVFECRLQLSEKSNCIPAHTLLRQGT